MPPRFHVSFYFLFFIIVGLITDAATSRRCFSRCLCRFSAAAVADAILPCFTLITLLLSFFDASAFYATPCHAMLLPIRLLICWLLLRGATMPLMARDIF